MLSINDVSSLVHAPISSYDPLPARKGKVVSVVVVGLGTGSQILHCRLARHQGLCQLFWAVIDGCIASID